MSRRVKITGDLFHPQVPSGAQRVDRATRWGNPHPVGKPCPRCHHTHDRDQAVAAFADDLEAGRLRISAADVCEHLAGLDLACWCKPEQTCHADVLLNVANRKDRT